MATMNPGMMQGGQDGDGMDPEGAGEDASEGGYTIEIEVDGAGKITVSAESASQEDAESQGGEDDANSIPVDSIGEACKLAEQIYKNNGQMPSQNGMSVEDAFGKGFQGNRVG